MSKTIDNRVVQMTFDNQQFEKNVKQSMNSLNQLDNSLKTVGKDNTSFAGLTESIKNLETKVSSINPLRWKIWSDIIDAAKSVGSKIVTYLFKPLEQMKTGGWTRALNIEQAKFQLEGMGLDVEKAMHSAMEAVNDTAFALDEAASVAAQLGASGVDAGAQMEGILKAISGVASVTNRTFSDIGMVFMRASGAGRVTGDTLMELSVRGLNAAAILGEAFHKSEADIRKMVSQGKISFQEFADIMQEKYADQAFKANETFQGSLNNLKSALNKIGADFSQYVIKEAIPLFNSLRVGINKIRKELTPVSKEFGEILHIFQKFITAKIDAFDFESVRSFVDGLANILTFIVRVAIAVRDAFADMFPKQTRKSLNDIVAAFEAFTDRLANSQPIVEAVKNAIMGIVAVFDIFKQVIVGLAKAILPGVNTFGDIIAVVIALIGYVGKLIVQFDIWLKTNNKVNTAINTIKNSLIAIVAVIAAVVMKVTEFIKQLKNSEVVASIIKKVTDAFEKFKSTLSGFSKTVSDVNKAGSSSGSSDTKKGGMFSFMTESLQKFLDVIKKVVGEITPAKVIIAAFVAFIGGLAIAFAVAANKFSESCKQTSSVLNNFWNVYVKFKKKTAEADEKKEKTKKWASFLIVVAELTAIAVALKGLASQPLSHILAATVAMGAIIYEVWAITNDIAKLPNKEKVEKNLKSMKGVALLIAAVGVALSIAAKKPWPELLAAGVAMGLCMQSVIKTIKTLSEIDSGRISQTMDIMGKLSAIVASFPVIASALKKLQKMEVGQILAASVGMSACILSIGKTIDIMSGIKDESISAKKIASIIAVCVGARLIGTALAKAAEIQNWKSLAVAAVGITATLGALTGVIWVMSKIDVKNVTNLVALSAAMTIASFSLVNIANALQSLTYYDWGSMWRDVIAMTAVIVAMGGVLAALTAISVGSGGVGAAVIVAIAAAVVAMGYAAEEASRGVLMIASALDVLQRVDIKRVALGMLDIAGAVNNFPVMKTIGLAAACILGGEAFYKFALGIQEFAKADLSNLASNIDVLFQAISNSSSSFVDVGANLTALGLGLQTVAKAVQMAGIAMVPLGVGLAIAGVGILAVGAGLRLMAPALQVMQELDWVTLGSGLANVAEGVGKLAIAGVAISLASTGLAVGAVSLGAIAAECWAFTKLDLISVARGLASVAAAGQKIGIAGLEMAMGAVGVGAMAIAIAALGKTVSTSAIAISNGVKITVNALELLKKVGSFSIQGLLQGLSSGLSSVAKMGGTLGTMLLKGITTVLGIHSPSTVLRKIGDFTGLGFCNGIADMMDDAEKSGKSLGMSAILGTEGLGSLAEKAGQALGLDFSNGFEGVINSLLGGVGTNLQRYGANGMPSDIAAKMAKSGGMNGLKNSVKDLLGINLDLDESLKNITSSAGGAGEALSGMGEDAKKGAKGVKEAKDEITSFIQKIEGSFNILDEFDLGIDEENPLTKDKLLSNMRSNIEGMAKWSNEMESLSTKVSQGLYKKLADMGPQGYKYVHAFTEMTKEELELVNTYYATSLVIPTNVATQVYRGMADAGNNALTGYINGLNIPYWQDLGTNLATDFLKGMKTQMGIASPSKETYQIGVYSTEGLSRGLKDASAKEALFYTVSSMCRDILTKFRLGLSAQDFKAIGRQITDGLKLGLDEGTSSVETALTKLCNKIKSTVTSSKNLDINSPSKVFESYGKYVDQGLALGITRNIGMVESSTQKMADATVDSMRDAISTIQAVVDSDMDVEPVIRPVVDLSNVQNGSSMINSLMGSSFGTNVTMPQASFMTTSQLISNTDNSDVVNSIVALQGDVLSLKDAMTNIKMVLDTGTMVGAMTPAIDQQLGRNMIYAGRGI